MIKSPFINTSPDEVYIRTKTYNPGWKFHKKDEYGQGKREGDNQRSVSEGKEEPQLSIKWDF